MNIVEVTADDLPGDATHGFKIVDGDENVIAFFHWHEEGKIVVPVAKLVPGRTEDAPEIEWEDGDEHRTSYADVLEAIPKRLTEMGLKKEVNAIMREIHGMYGEA